jgi:hypothetical protein
MVPRLRTTAIAGLAVSALLATSGVAYAHDLHLKKVAREASAAPSMSWAFYSGKLTDLSPGTPDVFDGARATATMIGMDGSSYFRVQVKGLAHGAVGNEYPAHLHVGPCGLDANRIPTVGGHYNTNTAVPVSEKTEVHLDFKVNSNGNVRIAVNVPFVPTPGDRSIVFHTNAPTPAGTPPAKLACLPLTIKEVARTTG